MRRFLASSTSSCRTMLPAWRGAKSPSDRPSDLRNEDRLAVKAHWRNPYANPGRRRACLRAFPRDHIRLAAEDPLRQVGRVPVAPVVASDGRGTDVREGSDEDSIQRVALRRSGGIGRTAGQPLEGSPERGEVLVVRDLRIGILVPERRQPLIEGFVRHWQKQRERDQCFPSEKIHIEQLRARLWIGEEDTRARRPRLNRALEAAVVEVLVDAPIRATAKRRVHGPGDFQRREIVRIGSRPQ